MKRSFLTLAFAIVAFVGPARAQPSEETPADERSTAFEAVEGSGTENVSGLGLMVGAYGLVWALTMLYLVRIGRLEAKLAADLERLEKLLAAGEDEQA